MCSSAVQKKKMQTSKNGSVILHERPAKTFTIRDWKTAGLHVRPIGTTSHLKEPNRVLKAVYS